MNTWRLVGVGLILLFLTIWIFVEVLPKLKGKKTSTPPSGGGSSGTATSPTTPASGSGGSNFSFRQFWGQYSWAFWLLSLLVIFWQFLPEEMSKKINDEVVGLLGPNWKVYLAFGICLIGLLWSISFLRSIIKDGIWAFVMSIILMMVLMMGKNILCSSSKNCDWSGKFKTQSDMPGYTLVASDCTPFTVYVPYGVEDGQFWSAAKPYEVWQNGLCLVKCDGVNVTNLGTIQPGNITVKSQGSIGVQLWLKYRQ